MKITFVGFLANSDDSITKIHFERNFNVMVMDIEDVFPLIMRQAGESRFEVAQRIRNMALATQGDNRLYAIRKTIDLHEELDGLHSGDSLEKAHEHALRLMEEVEDYILEKLRLIRLYKECNLSMPYSCVFVDQEKPISLQISFSLLPIAKEPFHIESSEIDELMQFLSKNSLPFADKSLDLSFNSFESSYAVFHTGLSLLACVISIECLLNPGGDEATHKISRNAAALLGEDVTTSDEVFRSVKELYNKRSKLVHEGAANVTTDDLENARKLVRSIIKNYIKTGLGHEALLDRLFQLGFGEERRW